MVWRQDAVSLCDTGRTWHCLSELMVADDSQEYTKQRVLEMTFTAWTVIALSFLAGPHYVLYTVQMRILMWTRQNIKQYHCDYFFKKITFIWLQHFLWQYLHLHGGKIKTTYKRERKIQCYGIFKWLSHCDYWQDQNHFSENWNTNMIYVF